MLMLRSSSLSLSRLASFTPSLSPFHHFASRAALSPAPLHLRPSSFRMSSTTGSDADAAVAPPPQPPPPSPMLGSKIHFCQACGSPTKHTVPDGEERVRAVCTSCGRIHYENPKMVVGCIVEHDNKVLLCRRKIEPSYGLWTLPAGYLENGESVVEGATRETLEEACAHVEILSPFAHLDIPFIGQVIHTRKLTDRREFIFTLLMIHRSYIIFRARLKTPDFSPGPESLECALFSLADIPFDSLAFSSIIVTLKMYAEDVKSGKFKFHYCTIRKRPGASPSDLQGFELDSHLEL